MRRPRLHRPTPADTSAWARPYTGVASMAVFYNGDPTTPPAPNPADPPKPGPPPGRVFTQDEVQALAAKEKDQGKRAGAREAIEELLTQLEFKSVDDVKAFVTVGRKQQEAQLSEEEKRKAELDRREQELAAKEAAATALARNAARRSVLVGLGATGDDLEDAAALLRVPDDADATALQEAAAALKERRPELFGGTKTPQPAPVLPPAPGGAPAGGPPRTPATKDDVKARARALAEKMGYAKPAA